MKEVTIQKNGNVRLTGRTAEMIRSLVAGLKAERETGDFTGDEDWECHLADHISGQIGEHDLTGVVREHLYLLGFPLINYPFKGHKTDVLMPNKGSKVSLKVKGTKVWISPKHKLNAADPDFFGKLLKLWKEAQ